VHLPVYLGHGGARAAEYVKQHLFSNLIKHPKFFSDTNAAISMKISIMVDKIDAQSSRVITIPLFFFCS
jgi:hypothetical protein